MKNSTKVLFVMVIALFVMTNMAYSQKETRNVSEFTKISFSVSGRLYLRQGNTQSLVLEGDDLDEISTEVSGGKLRIKKKNSTWNWGRSKIDVYITVKNLEEINLSGSGKIIGETKFEVEDLELSISGSGDMKMDVYANRIETGISGSGSVELKGVSGQNRLSISGSGKFDAEDMEAESYKISISGSGSCRINVSKEIDARVSGSGSIYYRGNPDKVYNQSSGSGKIRKI